MLMQPRRNSGEKKKWHKIMHKHFEQTESWNLRNLKVGKWEQEGLHYQ